MFANIPLCIYTYIYIYIYVCQSISSPYDRVRLGDGTFYASSCFSEVVALGAVFLSCKISGLPKRAKILMKFSEVVASDEGAKRMHRLHRSYLQGIFYINIPSY